MRDRLTIRQVLQAVFILVVCNPVYASNKKFDFVALGDTAYTEARYPEYRELIGKINGAKPAFTIHVGDTMGGIDCSDEAYKVVESFFDLYEHPLIYTPGDNEWTDCWDVSMERKDGYLSEQGKYKLNRLQSLRKTFFSNPKSLGKKALSLTRQSDISEYKQMVENAYWYHNEVLFVTVHVVGSADGMNRLIAESAVESVERRMANRAWLEFILEEVKGKQPKAVVIAMHAELFLLQRTKGENRDNSGREMRGGREGPYVSIVDRIARIADVYKRPMLVINGDFHTFEVGRPFHIPGSEEDLDSQRYDNITRLQVFGAPELRAVRITVEPETPWVFGFTPLF